MSTITLRKLFEELDECESYVPVGLLVDRIKRLDLASSGLENHVRFADDGYCRNLVHLGPGYAAFVLCWRSGQASPLHDHQGSACGVRVLRGTATEVRYERRPDGTLAEGKTTAYPEGGTCGTYDSDIHTVINCQPAGQDLITLHVYTPPMRSYHTYTVDGVKTPREDMEVLAEERRQAEIAAKAPRPSRPDAPRRRPEPTPQP